MARKSAMATEPKTKPPTGGGLKAKPNLPLQRLSPGVYRSAGGGLVNQSGRPIPRQVPGTQIAQSLPNMSNRMGSAGDRMAQGPGGMGGTQMPVGAEQPPQISPEQQRQMEAQIRSNWNQSQLPDLRAPNSVDPSFYNPYINRQESMGDPNKFGVYRPGQTQQDYLNALSYDQLRQQQMQQYMQQQGYPSQIQLGTYDPRVMQSAAAARQAMYRKQG